VSAATTPTRAYIARPIMPSQSLRMATMPMTMAKIIRTPRIPQTRTVLSLEPNSLMAKFFTDGGAWLIESSPTAATGAPIGELIRAAATWATPSAINAVTMPTIPPLTANAKPLTRARCLAGAWRGG